MERRTSGATGRGRGVGGETVEAAGRRSGRRSGSAEQTDISKAQHTVNPIGVPKEG